MPTFEPAVTTLAMVYIDAIAVAEAVLEDDFDEVRFHLHRLALKADALELPALSAAAALVRAELGPLGATPGLGYGAGLMSLADTLSSLAAFA